MITIGVQVEGDECQIDSSSLVVNVEGYLLTKMVATFACEDLITVGVALEGRGLTTVSVTLEGRGLTTVGVALEGGGLT